MSALLEIKGLHTHFMTKEGTVKAVNGIDLSLERGEVLGLVGESGSGKTVTGLSILGLVPSPGKVVQGSILYDGHNLLEMRVEELRRIRGKEISMIFQETGAGLNPVLTIGVQVEELLLAHTDMTKKVARSQAVTLLGEMGLPEPQQLLNRYPFQLSGGMAQRVMLAMGLALKPRVIIADEPTSNLDVTIQADVLQRLKRLQREQGAAVLLITHDMGVIAQMADEVAVMYAGSIVELAPTRELFKKPVHPYTWGLFQTLPRIDDLGRRLVPMRGTPPNLMELTDQCPFIPRCPKANNTCRLSTRPQLLEVEDRHKAACYNQVQHQWD